MTNRPTLNVKMNLAAVGDILSLTARAVPIPGGIGLLFDADEMLDKKLVAGALVEVSLTVREEVDFQAHAALTQGA